MELRTDPLPTGVKENVMPSGLHKDLVRPFTNDFNTYAFTKQALEVMAVPGGLLDDRA